MSLACMHENMISSSCMHAYAWITAPLALLYGTQFLCFNLLIARIEVIPNFVLLIDDTKCKAEVYIHAGNGEVPTQLLFQRHM